MMHGKKPALPDTLALNNAERAKSNNIFDLSQSLGNFHINYLVFTEIVAPITKQGAYLLF